MYFYSKKINFYLLLSSLFYFTLPLQAASSQTSTLTDSLQLVDNDLKSMKKEVGRIQSLLSNYESSVFDSLINAFDNNLKITRNYLGKEIPNYLMDSETDQTPLEMTKQSLDRLRLIETFYREVELKKDTWSGQYHTLWERSFYLKQKLDGLYVRERTEDYNFGGFEEVKFTNIRKKPIYLAYSSIYQNYINQLKVIAECDYQKRKKVLENVMEVLEKADALFMRKDSKELEKQLRRAEGASWKDQEKMILEY